MHGHADIISLLLKHGTDPDKQGPDGFNALYQYSKGSKPETCEVVIERYNADIVILDDDGKNAKEIATESRNY